MRRRWVATAVALACVAGLTACIGREPVDPSPGPTASISPTTEPTVDGGLELGVVYAPEESPDAQRNDELGDAVAALRRTADEDLAIVREMRPATTPFRRDMLALLAEEGMDVVCALGPASATDVLAVAADHPATRFCVLDAPVADPDEPPLFAGGPRDALAVVLQVEEAGFVAGGAAAIASAGPVGFVGRRAADPLSARQQRAYQSGARYVRARATIRTAYVGPAGDEARAERVSTVQYEGGVETVYAVLGDAASGVAAAAAANDGLVVATGRDLAGSLPDEQRQVILASVVVRFGPALRTIIERAQGDWRGGVVELGFAQRAFAVVPGDAPEYAAVEPRLDELIEQAGVRTG